MIQYNLHQLVYRYATIKKIDNKIFSNQTAKAIKGIKLFTGEPLLTTTSLLQPLLFAPNELKFQSFPQFYNFVALLRPHFHGPKVVVLTGFYCRIKVINRYLQDKKAIRYSQDATLSEILTRFLKMFKKFINRLTL